MKVHNLVIASVVGMSLMVACGGNDLDSKKADLIALKSESIELSKKIKTLAFEIDSLEGGVKDKSYTPVKVQQIKLGEFTHEMQVQGVVDATNDILINSEVPAVVLKRNVREGDKVTKGQVLLVLNSDMVDRNINELKGNLGLATTIFEKQKKLQEQNIGTEIQYLDAKNRKESLENTLKTLQTQKAKFTVKSPISGFVDNLMVKEGEMVNPAMPVARVVNADKVNVKADVSEAMLGKVKVGDMVDVHFPSINFSTKGKVIQNGNYIDPQNRTFKLLIDLQAKNDLLKPNLLSVVKIVDYHQASVVSIPVVSVQDDLKGQYVYLLSKDNTAIKKYVTTGKLSLNMIEIKEGLSENDVLITVGQRNIADGEKVTVVK